MKSLLHSFFVLIFCFSSYKIFSQSLGNNTCATAVLVPTTGVCVSGNNNTANATGDPTASCYTVENGIWFRFVAPASGVVDITTDDPATNFDSQLTLYSGACGSLTELSCDDDGGTGNTALIHQECLTPGQTYYVMMDGYAGDIGNFCIKITTVNRPLNDFCSCATVIPTNGTCLNNQTTVGATDGWTGIVGCQSGNNPEVWYTFVADSSSVTFTVTAGSMGGNVEMVLVQGVSCGSFTVNATDCGPSPSTHTFLNLTVGATYYLTISSSGAAGTFTICGLSSTPPPVPGQDCPNAAELCSNAPFSQPTSSAGFGVQEVTPSNSCWGSGGERQSRWYKFTTGTNGTLAFEINPNVNTDDYDWALWDITTSGCPTAANTTNDAIACNWWGTTASTVDIEGSTGLSIYTTAATICASQSGAVDNDAGAAGCQPYSFANFTSGLYGPLTVQAGHTYALLIDNFSTSNNGFSFTFGGTAEIGPVADFLTLKSCTSATLISAPSTSNTTYNWNYGDGATSTTSYSVAHTYTAAGTYSTSLQVTDALGCSSTYNNVLNIGNPSLVVSPSQTICANETTSVQATATPNEPQVSFTNTTSIAIPSNNATGITSTISVSGITPTTINTNQMVRVCLNITHTVDNDLDIYLVCPSGNTITLASAVGGTGDNFTNTCFTGLISNPINAGIAPSTAPFTGYYESQTNFSGLNTCNINGTWTLWVRDVVAGASGTLNNWSMTFNSTSNTVNYAWSPAASLSATNIANPVASPTATTIYTVVATDAQGCQVTGTTQVVVNPIPTPTITASTNTLCLGSSFTFTGSGASTYSWSAVAGGGLSGATGSTISATPTSTGNITYSLAVTGANSCTNTAIRTITVNPSPTANAGSSPTITCTNGTVALSGSGGGTYAWTGPGIVSGSATATPSVNVAGTYSLVVTSGGCSSPAATVAVISNTAAPTLTVSGSQTITCAAPTVTMTGAATPSTCTPVWTGGVSSGAGSYTATASSANVYTLTVTNPANGCFASGTVTVSPSAGLPTFTPAVVSNSITCSLATAQVTLQSSPAGNTYTWTGTGITAGATTSVITVNAGGTFTAVVTNTASMCSSSITAFVPTNTTAPTPTATSSGTLTCVAASQTVSLTASPSSGMTYTWTGTGIVSGANSSVATVSLAGTYSLAMTNTVNGCSSNTTVAVVQNTASPSVVAAASGSLNCTVSTVSVSATTTVAPVSYTWTGTGITSAANISTITVNQGGTFNYTVTNTNNSCVTTGTVGVTQNTLSPSVAAAASGSLNCTTTTVNASATTTAPVSYTWTGTGITSAANISTITVNQGGTFNYTVTNTSNNCVTTGSLAVIQNTTSPLVVSATSGSLNCTVTTVSVSVSTAATPVSYTWTGTGITSSATGSLITVNQGGTFNYSVTNTSNNCRTIGSEVVIQNTISPSVVSAVSGSLNCVVTTVSVSANTTVTPVSYNWSGPGITGGSGTGTITANIGGTYNYTVTNTDNTCVTTGSAAVTQNTTAPATTASNTTTLTCTVLNATLTGGPASGVTYQWSGPSLSGATTNSTAVATGPGNYTLVATSTANSCTASAVAAVTQNTAAPSVAASNTGSLNCTTTTVNVAATTTVVPVSYTWSGPGITAGAGTGTITVSQGGTYNYTVTNTANSCSVTGSQAITQNTTAPSVAASNTGSLNCTTTTVNVAATTTVVPVSYTWSGPGITAGAGTGTITANLGGTYNYTVTNTANTCSTTGSQAITQNTTAPTTTASTTGSITCTTNTIALNSTLAGMNYTWTAPGGSSVISGSSLQNAVGQGLGTYTLNVLNPANNCTYTTTTSAIQNTTQPTGVSAGANQTITCGTSSVALVGTATPTNSSITWLGGVCGSAASLTTAACAPGTYTMVAAHPVTGCTVTSVVSVSSSTDVPQATVNPITNSITCTNSVVTIGVTLSNSDPVTYTWSGPGISGSTTNPVTTATVAGTYSVLITNTVSSCQSIYNTVVPTNTTPVTVSVTPASSITCANTTSTLNISPVGANYTYTWTGTGITAGANSSNPVVNMGGTYSVVVTNTVNGCVGTNTLNVPTFTTLPTVTVTPSTYTTTCASPTVQLVASSTSSDLTYSWTPNGGSLSSNTIFDPIANGGGTYDVVVTNTISGCQSMATATVVPDLGVPVISLSANSLTITCTNTTVTSAVTSTNTTLSYTWSPVPVSGGANPIFDTPATYNATITASNGCSTFTTVNVALDNTVPSLTVTPSVTLTCNTPSVTLSTTVNPTADIVYDWVTTGVVTSTLDVNAPADYTVVVTNTVNGCSNNGIVSVASATTAPTVSLAVTSLTTTCANPTVQLNATGTPTDVAYTWTAPATGSLDTYTVSNPIASGSGIFTVSVTNTLTGCSTSVATQGTVEVIPDAGVPAISVAANSLTLTCTSTTVTTAITSTNTTLVYTWNPAPVVGGDNPVFDTQGTYDATITASNGCSAFTSVNVSLDNVAPSLTVTPSETITCTNTLVTLSSTVNPTSNIDYAWTGSGIVTTNTASAVDVNAADVYTLTVLNTVNGCTATATSMVTSNTIAPTVVLGTANSVTTSCAAPMATLSVSSDADPNTTFVWTDPSLATTTGSTLVTSTPGIYTVVVTNTINGCSLTANSQATVEVVADANTPVIAATPNTLTITCTNTLVSSTITSTNTTLSYTWSPAPLNGVNSATADFDQPGVYTASVLASNGCTAMETVTVTLDNTVPTVSLTSSVNDGTLTCSVNQIPVSPTVTPVSSDLTYTWTTVSGSGLASPDNTANTTFTAQGVYGLVVTNTLTGCVSTIDATTTFTVYSDVNTPTVSINAASTNSTIGCGGSSSTVTLNGNITVNGSNTYTYVWLPIGNTITTTIDVTTADSYTLFVTDAVNSCTQSAVFAVAGNTNTPGVNVTPIVSMPCGVTSATLSGVSGSTNTVGYNWSGPGTIIGGTTTSPVVDQPGNYTVTVTDLSNNCTSTATVDVSITNVTATISANPTEGLAPLPVDFTCVSSGATTWTWNFGDGNTSTSQNPSNTFNTSGTYTVLLTASAGTCTTTQTITIVVEDGLTIEIPNVFTPNNDGVNDLFVIKSTGVKEISLQIFNRWGEKLYEFAGDRAAWDGKTGTGAEVPDATYFYFVKAKGFDGKEIEKHGSMNLFR